MRPTIVLRKAQAEQLPIVFPFPQICRPFCCFVEAKYKDGKTACGSGTLTDLGVITAYHLVNGSKGQSNLIYTTFLLQDGHLVSFEVNKVLHANPKQDIVVLEHPKLAEGLFKPIKLALPFLNLDEIWESDVYAFGCPSGILGITWKPLVLGVSESAVFTNLFACLGISGGGIFSFHPKFGFVLWAVHSEFYSKSGTLISRLVKL